MFGRPQGECVGTPEGNVVDEAPNGPSLNFLMPVLCTVPGSPALANGAQNCAFVCVLRSTGQLRTTTDSMVGRCSGIGILAVL